MASFEQTVLDEPFHRAAGFATREKQLQMIALRLAAPKRARADQADAGHLPLFIAANEPPLL